MLVMCVPVCLFHGGSRERGEDLVGNPFCMHVRSVIISWAALFDMVVSLDAVCFSPRHCHGGGRLTISHPSHSLIY
jgi:hypothetical protein